MRGRERDPENRVITEFVLPAIVEHKEWKYFGARILVSNTADGFLVKHMIGLQRH